MSAADSPIAELRAHAVRRIDRRRFRAQIIAAFGCGFGVFIIGGMVLGVLEAFPPESRHLVEALAGELLLVAFVALAVVAIFKKRG